MTPAAPARSSAALRWAAGRWPGIRQVGDAGKVRDRCPWVGLESRQRTIAIGEVLHPDADLVGQVHPVLGGELVQQAGDAAVLGLQVGGEFQHAHRRADPSLSRTACGSTQYPSASS